MRAGREMVRAPVGSSLAVPQKEPDPGIRLLGARLRELRTGAEQILVHLGLQKV